MSHFGVIVCLPKDTQLRDLENVLEDVMSPWDENRSVEPYRSYEKDSAESFWWVRAVRDDAEHHYAGTIDERDRKSAVYGRPDKTDDELRAEYADGARWAEQLGPVPTTWEKVVPAYNEKWGHGSALATTDDDGDSETMFYEAESGRAYTMSTYNPESKWDYWRIGGRWRGYFVVKEDGPGLISASKSWDSPEGWGDDQPRCDGGPKRLLDFEAMREKAARDAHERYSKWEAICAEVPPAKAWSHFTGLVDLGELTIDDARRQYHAQEAIKRATKRGEELTGWGDCPVEHFMSDREEYVAQARNGAVPTYALVTLDREWIAPGRMGWFGMSSDGPGERDGYRIAVNHYLEDLSPDTFVVVLDCHI